LHKEDFTITKKLPYKAFATMQEQSNAVGWISMNHSADYVELAMYGPGRNFKTFC
jgi:alkaline phosphatase